MANSAGEKPDTVTMSTLTQEKLERYVLEGGKANIRH